MIIQYLHYFFLLIMITEERLINSLEVGMLNMSIYLDLVSHPLFKLQLHINKTRTISFYSTYSLINVLFSFAPF